MLTCLDLFGSEKPFRKPQIYLFKNPNLPKILKTVFINRKMSPQPSPESKQSATSSSVKWEDLSKPEIVLDDLATPAPQPAEIEQFLDALLKSEDPAAEMEACKESGLLQKVVPELAFCWGPDGEQDQRWHPEGNVWQHIKAVIAALPPDSSDELRLAALFHDCFKPQTIKRWPDNGISNHGHDCLAAWYFKSQIGSRLGLAEQMIDNVAYMIRYHMIIKKTPPLASMGEEERKKMLTHPALEELLKFQLADEAAAGLSEELRRDNSEEILKARDAFLAEG